MRTKRFAKSQGRCTQIDLSFLPLVGKTEMLAVSISMGGACRDHRATERLKNNVAQQVENPVEAG